MPNFKELKRSNHYCTALQIPNSITIEVLYLTSGSPHPKGVLVDCLQQVVRQVDRAQVPQLLEGEGIHGGDGVPGQVDVLQAAGEGLLPQGSDGVVRGL